MLSSRKMFIVAALAFALLPLAACGNGSSNADAEVVARVGSRDITLTQVDRIIKQQMEANGTTLFTPAQLVEVRLSVAETLIREEALFQKAQKENLVPDDNKVTQELAKFKQDRQLTEDRYQESLKQAGLTEEEFRNNLRRQLAIAELEKNQRTRVAAPTEAEIKTFYDERKEGFVAQRGVNLSIIVTDPANNGARDDAIGEQQAEAKIKTIHEQLKQGTDFATVAQQRSEHQSAVNGGNLGFGSEAALRQQLPIKAEVTQRLLTTMTVGQYTEPIKTDSGPWIIIKLNSRQDQPQNLTLDQVRSDVVEELTQQRQKVLLDALTLVALAEANVKNYLAERIVQDPKRIVELRPSALIDEARTKVQQQQQQQPQQRIENANQPAANANTAAPANANRGTGAANANR